MKIYDIFFVPGYLLKSKLIEILKTVIVLCLTAGLTLDILDITVFDASDTFYTKKLKGKLTFQITKPVNLIIFTFFDILFKIFFYSIFIHII